jgi:hypothetical protein
MSVDACSSAANPSSATNVNTISARRAAQAVEGIVEHSRVDRGEESAGSSGFFSVDYRAWKKACSLGIGPAVCYLALARGTQRDNRTTSWSVHAIETRTGISRHKVAVHLLALRDANLVRDHGGSAKRPRRYLVPGHEIGNRAMLPLLTEDEQLAFQRLPLKAVPKLPSETIAVLRSLTGKGWAKKRGTVYEAASDVIETDAAPDWIWLPNSLIDGASGEPSPIEVIRQTHNRLLLRMFVTMYHMHALSHEGGIASSEFCRAYKRADVALVDRYRVWAFEPAGFKCEGSLSELYMPFFDDLGADQGDDAFWEALHLLERLGYVSFVPHLFESAGGDAEIIHPMNKMGTGYGDVTSAEAALYESASAAALTLLDQELGKTAPISAIVVPVRSHISAVEMRGVCRLRYRPHTAVTAEWLKWSAKWVEWRRHYDELGQPVAAPR